MWTHRIADLLDLLVGHADALFSGDLADVFGECDGRDVERRVELSGDGDLLLVGDRALHDGVEGAAGLKTDENGDEYAVRRMSGLTWIDALMKSSAMC